MILQLIKSEDFMRLTNYEIISIKESFHQVFGSGVDDSLKGSNINNKRDTRLIEKEALNKRILL
jgi:hypothetical protein